MSKFDQVHLDTPSRAWIFSAGFQSFVLVNQQPPYPSPPCAGQALSPRLPEPSPLCSPASPEARWEFIAHICFLHLPSWLSVTESSFPKCWGLF